MRNIPHTPRVPVADPSPPTRDNSGMKRLTPLLALLGLSQTGCIMAGYSTNGGWFVWPGGLGLLLIVALIYFAFGRR
jgi:hypothetical protein